jgi:hypothetical protein
VSAAVQQAAVLLSSNPACLIDHAAAPCLQLRMLVVMVMMMMTTKRGSSVNGSACMVALFSGLLLHHSCAGLATATPWLTPPQASPCVLPAARSLHPTWCWMQS